MQTSTPSGLPLAILPVSSNTMAGDSFSAQYDALFSGKAPLDSRARLPKPSMEEQAKEPGAWLVPLSDGVYVKKKLNNWVEREPWSLIDLAVRGCYVTPSHAPFALAGHPHC